MGVKAGHATKVAIDPPGTRLPPPVPDGEFDLESLGRWIDNLMGAARDRRAADAALNPFQLRDEEVPEDPPPVEMPPPVPEGEDVMTRGADPDQRK